MGDRSADAEPTGAEPTDAGTTEDVSADNPAGGEPVSDESTVDEPSTDADIIDADAVGEPGSEDRAQASARSDIVSDDELADAGGSDDTDAEPIDASEQPEAADTPDQRKTADTAEQPETTNPPEQSTDPDGLVDTDDRPRPADGRVVSEPSEDETDMSELREQLNDQFESIKIVEPGQYELNLMELYDRDEYIIALRENGRYVIQMPEEWLGDRDIDE